MNHSQYQHYYSYQREYNYENNSPAPSQSFDVIIGAMIWTKSFAWKEEWIDWIIEFLIRLTTPWRFDRGRRCGIERKNSGLWN